MVNEQISDLVGKVLVNVKVTDDFVEFELGDNERYQLVHFQDCCESVYVEDVCGDISDLVGSPIIIAEEVSNETDLGPKDCEGSYTWTFYKLSTMKGSVTIRFYGSSNGYYSESVNFWKVK